MWRYTQTERQGVNKQKKKTEFINRSQKEPPGAQVGSRKVTTLHSRALLAIDIFTCVASCGRRSKLGILFSNEISNVAFFLERNVKINRITSQTENTASSEFNKLQSYLSLPLDLNRNFKLTIYIPPSQLIVFLFHETIGKSSRQLQLAFNFCEKSTACA